MKKGDNEMSLWSWITEHLPVFLSPTRFQELLATAGEKGALAEREWWGERKRARLDELEGWEDPVTFVEAWQMVESAKLQQTLRSMGMTEATVGLHIDPTTLADRGGWILMGGLSSQEDANRVQVSGALFNLQDAAFSKAQDTPHAKGAVKTMRKYIAGRGVILSSSVPEVDAVIQDFWRQNALGRRHKAMVRSVYIEGEYYALYTIARQKGDVTLRRIPAKEIANIETDSEDIERKYSYHRKYVNATNQEQERFYADVDYYDRLRAAIERQEDPLPYSIYHEQLRQIIEDEISGDVLVQQIRWGEEGEKRGRVPMAAELPYFKMLEQFHQDIARRAHEQNKVIWLKKIGGRTTEATTRERRAPAGGVMLIETDTISYRNEVPQLAATDMELVRRMLLHTIGAGLQIPEFILDSNAENQNYASIKKADTPFIQEIVDWQDFWDDELRVMLRVPIRAKVRAGVLKETVPVTRYVEESLPPDSLLRANTLLAEGLMQWMARDGTVHATVLVAAMTAARSVLEGQEESYQIPTEEAPISIVFPVLVHEDPLAQAQALEIWQKLGVSSQTLLEKLGQDWRMEWVRQKAMREMLRQEQETAQKVFEKTPMPPSYEAEVEEEVTPRRQWESLRKSSRRVRRETVQSWQEIFSAGGVPFTEEQLRVLEVGLGLKEKLPTDLIEWTWEK